MFSIRSKGSLLASVGLASASAAMMTTMGGTPAAAAAPSTPLTAAVIAPAPAPAPAVAPAILGTSSPSLLGTEPTSLFASADAAAAQAAQVAAEQAAAAAQAAAAQAAAEQAAAAQAAAQAATQAANTWQVPVSSYTLTARFGEKGSWARGWHTGLDFAGPVGQDVRAAKAGTVVESGYQGAYGNTVVIDHGNGYKTRYAHLNRTPNVSVGQQVTGGQVIGALGNTGNSSGPHLHFEVMTSGGDFVNPAKFVNA